jgi:hypothetical protein
LASPQKRIAALKQVYLEMFPALPRLDANRAGLQGLRERRLVAGVEGALRGLGIELGFDPAHDSCAGREPFAPDLAARELAGFQEIVDGVYRDGEQRRHALNVEHFRFRPAMAS